MKPFVGMSVQFVSDDGERAAVVTNVLHGEVVNLAVFGRDGGEARVTAQDSVMSVSRAASAAEGAESPPPVRAWRPMEDAVREAAAAADEALRVAAADAKEKAKDSKPAKDKA